VAQWDRYAWQLAYRWHRRTPGSDIDDIVQEVRKGFVEAAQRFDPARGVGFSTYATHWGDMRARRFCRREAAGGFNVPINGAIEPIGTLSLSDTRMGDDPLADLIPERTSPDAPPVFGSDWWDGTLSCLPPRHREVLLLHFRDGLNIRKIGTLFGVSRQRVWQLAEKGMARLRKLKPELAELID